MLRTSSSRTSCLIQLLTVVFDAIFPFLFSSLTYHRVCNQINTTSATNGAGDAYPFRAPKFIPGFQLGWCYSIFSPMYIFCVDRCLSFCTFSFGHCVVCSSSIYGFRLPLWYLRAPRTDIINNKNNNKKQNKNTTSEQYQNQINGEKIDTMTRIQVADYFPSLVQALSLKSGRVKQTQKTERQLLINNPPTLTTLGTQDTQRRQAKHKITLKNKKMSNIDPTKNRG